MGEKPSFTELIDKEIPGFRRPEETGEEAAIRAIRMIKEFIPKVAQVFVQAVTVIYPEIIRAWKQDLVKDELNKREQG